MKNQTVIAIVVLVALLLVGWFVLRQTEDTPVPALTRVPQPLQQERPLVREEAAPAGAEEGKGVEQVELPPLEESDAEAREAVADVAPKIVAWLTPDQQIQKWVVAVDLAADGVLMEKNRPLAYPMSAFKVTGKEGDYQPDASNYGRADELVGALISIPPARAAALYDVWQPLLDKAYAELGKQGDFDWRLRTAIDNVVAVKPLSSVMAEQPLAGAPTLVRPKVYYRYADRRLEDATDIEKFMWRLGPENSQKLQAWLAEFRKAL